MVLDVSLLLLLEPLVQMQVLNMLTPVPATMDRRVCLREASSSALALTLLLRPSSVRRHEFGLKIGHALHGQTWYPVDDYALA